ncbi:hypothetical protein R1sor_026747 [Riccia sorocarpa]|uniref:DUF4283 domain-containing protein n=1 Tax=Riccia sorocarpa TaxID=122646 RepID=A0ABD3GED4_9MARC
MDTRKKDIPNLNLPNFPEEHTAGRSTQVQPRTGSNPGRQSPQVGIEEVEDSQTISPSRRRNEHEDPSYRTPRRRDSASGASWADMIDEERAHGAQEVEDSDMSELNSANRNDKEYMAQPNWIRDAKKEITEAFAKIQEFPGEPEGEEVIVEHHFNTEEQLKIHAQKRRLEDCGVVFCTVDISPSRDSFTQWLYQEVENKTAVQVSHVKVLAPRHYLVVLHSMEARDSVLVGGPYYLRKRMIYTTPWEPGFDTHKVLAKKMAVWLDLLNVDPMMEGVGPTLLGSMGSVLQVAGVTEKQEGKFANIRGCVLMDMTKPLPSILVLHMNSIQKKIKIR